MQSHSQKIFWIVFGRIIIAAILAVFILVGLPAVMAGLPAVASAQESNGDQERSVVINEVMWVGSTISRWDEWIELYNPTDKEIDISNWKITNAASNNKSITIPTDTTISKGSYLILSYYKNDHENSAFDFPLTPITELDHNISLANNENGNLILQNEGEEIIDTALARFEGKNDLDQSWPEDKKGTGEEKIRKSVERIEYDQSGEELTNWQLSATSEDDRNFGTPGAQNSEPPENQPPQAAASGPAELITGETAEFTAEDSSDPDGDNEQLNFLWLIDDIETSTEPIFEHTFNEAGEYVVKLIVNDGTDEDETTSTVQVSDPTYTDDIVINELLPDPEGSDQEGEYIELYNTGSSIIDLSGWEINDKKIPDETEIAGLDYLLFERNSFNFGSLVNGGDTVTLKDPNEETKDSVQYSDSNEDESYNRTEEGDYQWSTTLTPGAKNEITAAEDEDENDEENEDEDADEDEDEDTEEEDEEETTTEEGEVAGAQIKEVALKNIRLEQPGTEIKTTGTVSAPPGIFSDRYMYLAGSGIQVYSYKENWPDLSLGDKISLTGELSSVRGEARIKLSDSVDIEVISKDSAPEPHQAKTGDIDEDMEGTLVTVTGQVTKTSGDTFYIDDGSGEIKIYIKSSTKIDKPKMKKGITASITGIVSETSTGYRVLPRWQEDVKVGKVAGILGFPAAGLRNTAEPEQWLNTGRQTSALILLTITSLYLLFLAKNNQEPLLKLNKKHKK